MRLRLTVFASLGLAVLFVPIALYAQQVVGNITGELKVERLGFPPKQVLVSLQYRGATTSSVYADSQGRFGFYSLPPGTYTLVIRDDDYFPVEQRVDLNPLFSQVLHTSITLTPRKVKSPDASADRVTGSNPNSIDPSEYTRKFPKKAVKAYESGLKANAEGHADNAARHFQKSIELAPDFYPAHNELGRIYMAKSDFGAAQREFEEAIRLNHSDAEAHLNLGNVFLLTKKYDDALKSVQEGLRRDPNSAVGEFVLGSVYERTGRFGEAERALQQALELDPKMSRVHLELANLYITQQKGSEASTELKAFLKEFPEDPLAPKAREVLNKLQKAAKESNARQ